MSNTESDNGILNLSVDNQMEIVDNERTAVLDTSATKISYTSAKTSATKTSNSKK